MYRKIYKYLGCLTLLLWAYGSCHVQAAIRRSRVSDYCYSYKSLNVTPEEIGDKLRSVAGLKKKDQPKNAVMVILGPNTDYIDNMSGELLGNSDSKPLELEEFHMEFKGTENVDTKNQSKIMTVLYKVWETRIKQEEKFMRKTFCSDDEYDPPCYVKGSYYLPRIYSPKKKVNNKTIVEEDDEKMPESTYGGQEDEKELPIYIVVPSLYGLLQGIFFERHHSSEFVMPTLEEEKIKCRLRLEGCLKIFNQYMEHIYSLVNIKALVISYGCTDMKRYCALPESVKLEKIDVLIRSFGKLLYKQQKEHCTINPQIFWLNWWENSNLCDQEQNLNKEMVFSNKLEGSWFEKSLNSAILYRQVSLLYPFLKAHRPKKLDNELYKKQYDLRDKELACINTLTITPVEEGAEQLFTLYIEDILQSSKPKSEKLEIFQRINKRIIDIVNSRDTSAIPHDLLELEFAIRYQYIHSYYTTRTDIKELIVIREFLCCQYDTPVKKMEGSDINSPPWIEASESNIGNLIGKVKKRYFNVRTGQENRLKFLEGFNRTHGDQFELNLEISNNGTSNVPQENKNEDLDNIDIIKKGKADNDSVQLSEQNKKLNDSSLAWEKNKKALNVVFVAILIGYFCYYMMEKQKNKNQEKATGKDKEETNNKEEASGKDKEETNNKEEASGKDKDKINNEAGASENSKVFLNSFLRYFFFFGVLLMLLIGLYFRWKRKK